MKGEQVGNQRFILQVVFLVFLTEEVMVDLALGAVVVVAGIQVVVAVAGIQVAVVAVKAKPVVVVRLLLMMLLVWKKYQVMKVVGPEKTAQ